MYFETIIVILFLNWIIAETCQFEATSKNFNFSFSVSVLSVRLWFFHVINRVRQSIHEVFVVEREFCSKQHQDSGKQFESRCSNRKDHLIISFFYCCFVSKWHNYQPKDWEFSTTTTYDICIWWCYLPIKWIYQ